LLGIRRQWGPAGLRGRGAATLRSDHDSASRCGLFACPLADAQGFKLIGGRADFVDGQRVAVVVYRHSGHVINLYVWADYEARPEGLAERSGYHFPMWNEGNLTFRAASDVAVADLQGFAKLAAVESATRAD